MKRRGTGRLKPAGTVLQQVRRDVERGWPAGLTVLTGDDPYHLDRAQAVLLDALVPEGASEFALTVYDEEKVEVGTVVSAARSAGMFADRRVVFVRDVSILQGEPDALAEFAARPPADSYLIVRAPALDLRRNLHKTLAGAGRLLGFQAAKHVSLRELRALAEKRGLDLDSEASSCLIQACGGDLYRLGNELDKIAAWTGGDGRRPVGMDAVREVAAGGGPVAGWAVADALMRRERGAALAAVRQAVEAGEEPLKILGGLAFRARALLKALARVEAGAGRSAVVRTTPAFLFGGTLETALERYSLDEVLRFPQRLLEADRMLKSRAIPPRAVLEGLIDRLTAPESGGGARPA